MKKVLTNLFIFLFILSVFVSCSNTTETTESDETGNEQSESITVPALKLDKWGREVVEDTVDTALDFDGETVRILINDTWPLDLFAEELSGDVVNDAVYERDAAVQERLNVVFTTEVPDRFKLVSGLNKSISAGDDTSDIVIYYSFEGTPMIIKGYFIDINQIPGLNFDKVWWDSAFNEEIKYNGKIFAVLGDLLLSKSSLTNLIYFNKTQAESRLGDVDLYQYIYDNKWTAEVFSSLIRDVYTDLNGNSERDDADFYGFYEGAADQQLAGIDVRVTEKDADGNPSITFNDKTMIDNLGILLDIIYENEGSLKYPQTTKDLELMSANYNAGNAIFMMDSLWMAGYVMRDMKDSFGILPYFKFSEAQEEYTYSNYGVGNYVSVPVTTQDTRYKMIGAVLELLSAESYRQVIPSYYEVAFKYKYLRTDTADTNDLDMYDLIIRTGTYNFGYLFSLNLKSNVLTVLRDIINNNNDAIVSKLETSRTANEASLQKLLEKLNAV
ncbi:MAG: hypothetical protein ACYCWE_06215 [Eubacteriales bacterium]